MSIKRIRVQNKLTTIQAILLSFFCILIAIGLIYIVATADYLRPNTKFQIDGLIFCIFFIFIPMWFANVKEGEKYVSELQLTDYELALVYKQQKKISKIVRINLDNIESIHAKLTANNVNTGRSVTLFCQTDVCIKTKENKLICFTETPTGSIAFCNYSFMLRLLRMAKDLPNFTFEVDGNSKIVKEDIQYFLMYGKRLSLLKKFQIELKNYPIFIKIILIMVLFVTGFFLYTIIPNYSNKVDREYVEYIDNGIFYYRNKNSNKAIIEFDKAQKIHDDDPVLYENKALAYQRNGNPKEAIETAKKGIECLENNSTYYRVKNHKFILKCNDIGFYRIIGECYLTLKQYDKAEDFYTYIIEHNSSEYTDAYLWRGFCRYKQ